MATVDLNLNYSQVLSIVKQLKPQERAKLIDEINYLDFEIPEEHKKITLDRVEKSKKNPALLLDFEIAIKRLKP
jgi:hypothetical protein